MVALAAYHLNIPIAQLEAGDISLEGTWDDSIRHCITLLSSLVFCNGDDSYGRARALLHLAGKTMNWIEGHVFEVGSIAFDDIILDYSLCPTGDDTA